MRNIPYVLLFGALTGCGDEPQATQPPEPLSRHESSPRYRIVKITSTLDGAASRGSDINELGWVAGFSDSTSGNRHATLWRHETLIDLKTLGGPHSNVQWHGLNNRGMVVGISETNETDSLSEGWSCAPFFASATNKVCRGFWWEKGKMHALPTLGGTHGYATSVNDHGQVVGWAENRVRDNTCDAPQVLQFRAVLWEPKKHRKRVLRPYRGDSTSAATAINNRGQVVGISGECDVAVGRFSAQHAVLWEHGKVIDLGNLGGTSWHTPTAISERGDIVGFSNPAAPGDLLGDFLVRAFLWTRQGGMRFIGRLPGDSTSQARGVNSRRQVVGVSTSPEGVSKAFLWDDGVMRNLNGLVQPGFADSLVSAQDIDESGRITGTLLERSSGRTLPFVAIPKEGRP